METIKITEVIHSQNAILHSFGMKVFEVAKRYLAVRKPVVLDFTGIQNVTTAFLHASIGNIVATVGSDSMLEYRGISEEWNQKIQQSIDSALHPEKNKIIDQEINNLFS
jgi:hypothetical protein